MYCCLAVIVGWLEVKRNMLDTQVLDICESLAFAKRAIKATSSEIEAAKAQNSFRMDERNRLQDVLDVVHTGIVKDNFSLSFMV
jgi:hypothetical protein